MSKAHQKGLASSIFASQIPPYLVQITACQRSASSPLNPPQNPRSTIQKRLAFASLFLLSSACFTFGEILHSNLVIINDKKYKVEFVIVFLKHHQLFFYCCR